MNKKDIATILQEISTLLQLKGENEFKARAYSNAARAIEMLNENIHELVEKEKIKDIKGIGKTLADNIIEMVTTKDLAYYHELKASIPAGLLEMLKIPTLGPKKVYRLYNELEIKTLGELEYACRENRLVELKGFGKKSQENVLRGLEELKKNRGKFLFSDAYSQAISLLNSLKKCPEVIDISLAGSLRRGKEVIKDIDLAVSSQKPAEVRKFFINLPPVEEILVQGNTKTSVKLHTGINVDLRVVTPEEYPSTLHYLTGSKEHNTVLRKRAKDLGFKLNEYGIFKGDKKIPTGNEREFFEILGLQYIPPELRENRGEIEKAQRKEAFDLVVADDLQGIFHVHTTYSDGAHTIPEMVQEAKALGYKYLGISDHSQSARYAGGLTIDEIKRQEEEIKEINATEKDFKVFFGIEADILPDGSLDYPEEILKLFDFVIASIHSGFNITGDKATERIIKALQNPYVTMLGHPTGRLLLGRKGYEPNMEEIIEKARENNVIIEFNTSPYRLDIDWRYLPYAKDKGVKISLNPDAHRKEMINDIFLGVKLARKGWLSKEDIFNCWPVEKVESFLRGNS